MKDEKSKYILHWIRQLSKIRPELGNFAICPYASSAKFTILDEKLSHIVPNNEFDVIIYVVSPLNGTFRFIYIPSRSIFVSILL